MKYFLISVYYQPIISDYCKYRKEVPKKSKRKSVQFNQADNHGNEELLLIRKL